MLQLLCEQGTVRSRGRFRVVHVVFKKVDEDIEDAFFHFTAW
jgi:hypothetical protein